MVELDNTLVSIIIPVYKVEQYLKRCVDSILNQTYPTLEIILVDDGSPDNCPAICDEYAKKDKRIKVIHKENGGLSSARNAGLDIATGGYISFVDSDDWVNIQYIEKLLSLAIQDNADIVIAEHIKTFGNENVKQQSFFHKIYNNKSALQTLYKNEHVSFTVSWGKLYKRDILSKIRFPLQKFHEDTFTTYLIFYASKKIVYTNQILYYYLQRNDSITSSAHSQDALESIEHQYTFFSKHKENEIVQLLLPQLCWQILYTIWEEYKKSKKFNSTMHSKLRTYTKTLKLFHTNILHYTFLHIFTLFPKTYLTYRKISPFHIREDS